jgi:hypothetical protein
MIVFFNTPSDTGLFQATLYNTLHLNTLFNPDGVFSAFKVQRARDLNCSISDLVLRCSWNSNNNIISRKSFANSSSKSNRSTSDGNSSSNKVSRSALVIKGLWIQGAVFDWRNSESSSSSKFIDCAPEDRELSALPPVWITYEMQQDQEQQQQIEDKTNNLHLEVPLYYNMLRERLISTLTLPCPDQKERTKWILASVAIFIEE